MFANKIVAAAGVLLLLLTIAAPLAPAETLPTPGQLLVKSQLYENADGSCSGTYVTRYAMKTVEAPLHILATPAEGCALKIETLAAEGDYPLIYSIGRFNVSAVHWIHPEPSVVVAIRANAMFTNTGLACPRIESTDGQPPSFAYHSYVYDQQVTWNRGDRYTWSHEFYGACWAAVTYPWAPVAGNADGRTWNLDVKLNDQAVHDCVFYWHEEQWWSTRADSCSIAEETAEIPDWQRLNVGTVPAGETRAYDLR